jgi:hypothetical protein
MNPITIHGDAGAIFSPCRRFRYHLHRVWDRTLPRELFVMLNPSTADEFKLDPTVTRCKKYAQAWGRGGFEVCNIFAYRATDPRDLAREGFPIGEENDALIYRAALAYAGRRVICAWGSSAGANGHYRALAVLTLIREAGAIPHALAFTSDGVPRHPLYLRGDLLPKIILDGPR